jgi:cardiolipin synthase A/B
MRSRPRPSRPDPVSPFEAHDPLPPVVTDRHSIGLLHGMEPFIRAFTADIERARERLFVEGYIFSDDSFGQQVADMLAGAAARGVATYVLYDPLGSQKSDAKFFEQMRERGLFVRAYRPLDVATAEGGLFPRDHARNIVIDGAAYTGGAAWAKPWLPKHRGGDGWHEVCVRVEGPVVESFAKLFGQRWVEADGGAGTLADLCTFDMFDDLELVGDTPKRNSHVFNRHIDAIARAKRRVWIENAYFLPPRVFADALYDATRRGVDVRVITCGSTDLATVKRAERAECETWAAHGLQVHEFERCMLHSKYALVDDDWCTIGSFNANATSVAMANELNLFVFEPRFVAQLAELFVYDFASSKPMDAEQLRRRPLVQKVGDRIARGLFHALDALAGPKPTDR